MTEQAERLVSCCGLYCGTCAFFHDSQIKKTAKHLKKLLDGFEHIAKIYENVAPDLKSYPEFVKVLNYLQGQNCLGCRMGGGTTHGAACMPLTCTMVLCPLDRGLDFCYQCSDFPCEIIPFAMKKSGQEGLIDIWLTYNKRMKKIGLDRYLQEKKREPRYKINKSIRGRKHKK